MIAATPEHTLQPEAPSELRESPQILGEQPERAESRPATGGAQIVCHAPKPIEIGGFAF